MNRSSSYTPPLTEPQPRHPQQTAPQQHAKREHHHANPTSKKKVSLDLWIIYITVPHLGIPFHK